MPGRRNGSAASAPNAVTSMGGRVGVPGIGRWVAPALRPPSLPSVRKVVTVFQAGHGWTNSGSGTVSDDTTDFLQGVQSLKGVTNGAAAATRLRKTSITPTLDLTANMLRIKFKVDVKANLSSAGVQLAASSDNFVANYSVGCVLGNSVAGHVVDDNWITVHVTQDDLKGLTGSSAVLTGTPTWTAINALQVSLVDRAGTPVTGHLQEVSLVPYPANGCICIGFDDGYLRNAIECAPYMDKYGFRANLFVIRDIITAADGASSLYMSINQLRRLHDGHGWEIGAHADQVANHNSANGLADLASADGGAFEQECLLMRAWLLAQGFRGSEFFAWPKGAYTKAHLAVARRYFSGIRTFQSNLNSVFADTYPLGDPGQIRQIAVTGGGSPDSAASVNTALAAAMTAKKTVLLTFHDPKTDVSDGASTSYPIANFQAIIDNIATQGWRVKTLGELYKDGVV